jgi:hypothetical protein
MQSKMINDWRPEVSSLLKTLISHEFKIVAGNNGDDDDDFKFGDMPFDQFVEELTACDEAWVWVKHKQNRKNNRIYLVFGNEPGVIASDWTILYEMPKQQGIFEEGNMALAQAVAAHNEAWQNKPQPKTFDWGKDPDNTTLADFLDEMAMQTFMKEEYAMHLRLAARRLRRSSLAKAEVA